MIHVKTIAQSRVKEMKLYWNKIAVFCYDFYNINLEFIIISQISICSPYSNHLYLKGNKINREINSKMTDIN